MPLKGFEVAMNETHEGHRERMRNRFREAGLDSFSDHEILELLLFYALPQKNTNEVAHDLIKTFGSLDKVLEADTGALIQVKGIKEASALYLNIICGVLRRYVMLKNTERDLSLRDISEVGNYLINYYTGITVEKVVALLFDSQNRLDRIINVSSGDASEASVDIQKILRDSIIWEASFVIVAHNHPNGELLPSSEDYMVTQKLCQVFSLMKITFVEHILVAGNKFMRLKHSMEL